MNEQLRGEVIARSRELGFDLCRFARADAPPHGEEFRQWLDDGRAGEMGYLARNAPKRLAPEKVLPGVKTIVVLGQNYFQGDDGEQTNIRRRGRIARYAWGDDYHHAIEEKLGALAKFLGEHGGEQKYYVDTGPILERDFAAVAGAGWQGKNTMLLNRAFGNWLFLSEILTTLEFAPDPSTRDYCGKCTRCLDACPTGALTAAHQLDARLCISYLTIELKGAIPVELRPLMGDRIYGCDECLDVCPWNRFAQTSRDARFSLPPGIAAMDLRDFLALDDDQFRLLFRRSPIKRTKRRGFLRNVCVALGNVGTAADLPSLRRAAVDPEPLIGEHARWAIAQIEGRMQNIESKRKAGVIG